MEVDFMPTIGELRKKFGSVKKAFKKVFGIGSSKKEDKKTWVKGISPTKKKNNKL